MSVIETFFIMISSLGCQKKIYVYSPNVKDENTPILFMQDGHNLFIPKDSYTGETWKIKETLDRFQNEGKKVPIVVGISADEHRFDEYSPWEADQYAYDLGVFGNQHFGGKGDVYIGWVVETLLPLIQDRYGCKGPIYMAGSSMGAYISLYAGYKYPHIIKKIGAFSPAFWFNYQAIVDDISLHFDSKLEVYLDIGFHESSHDNNRDFPSIYLDGARRFHDFLISKGIESFYYYEDPQGEHRESDWARRFPFFLNWLLGYPVSNRS